ncbi:MAG: hypothetical protein J6A75_08540 [Lachnospiraceae bacterium]|nr:hypothetical protein [Lachnospiraceae bacterium]
MDDPRKCADSNGHTPHSKVKKPMENPPVAKGLKQQSFYNKADKPAPDNSPFFVERSNPLSSKGN